MWRHLSLFGRWPLAGRLLLVVALVLVALNAAAEAAPHAEDPPAEGDFSEWYNRDTRAPRPKFIRFGRAGQKFIRFGRSSWDLPDAALAQSALAADEDSQLRYLFASPKRAQKFIRFG